MKPALEIFFEILIHTGLIIEGHSQNILYVLKNDVIDGIVLRDFESMDKDLEIGIQYNSLFNKEYKCISKDEINYPKRHSFMFDFKLGRYLLMPLIEAGITFGADKRELLNRCQLLSKKYLAFLPNDYFPKEGWYFLDNKLIDRKTKNFLFHIDNSNLKKTFNFRLTNIQRIDAYERIDKAYEDLVNLIQKIITH